MNEEAICALATPAGGAIGVIRVSGEQCIEKVEKLFKGVKLSLAKANTVHYGLFLDAAGSTIDQVVATVWRAPHSYTGEDAVELSFHGSPYILQQALHALIEVGCRQALPGEFTQRAYLNGKMDLSQAEAVADLIASTNQATHRLALSQLKGNFSSELSLLREKLLKMTSLLELELDFSDHEELEFANRDELFELAKNIDDTVCKMANSFATGQALKAGIPVAIVGKTNVGKSTLLNRLLNEERAIVSDIHGTTRDVIEDVAQIDGLSFRFIDTAGLRATDDRVEQIGIQRTFAKLDSASIVLWMVDAMPSADETTEMMKRAEGKTLIKLWNKADEGVDLTKSSDDTSASSNITTSLDSKDSSSLCNVATSLDSLCNADFLHISAKYGQGIDSLKAMLVKAAAIPEISENDVVVTSARHYEALTHAHESLSSVIEGLTSGLSADLLAEHLRSCLSFLAEITGGMITPNETLQNIFKHFCIGK